MRKRRARVAALVAVLLAAPGSFAQQAADKPDAASAGNPAARDRSRAAFVAGVDALEEGRARDALTHFEDAERLYPHYATAYNIGLCHRALGHPVEAAAAFQRYLDGAEGKISAEQFETVAGLIKEAEAKVASLTVRVTPRAATIAIDGATARAGEAMRVNPGERRIEVRAPGYVSATRVARVPSGASDLVDVVLAPAEAAERSEPAGPRLDGAFWALAGLSAALVATGAVTGAIALSDSAAYEDPATPEEEAEDRRSRGEVLRVVADVSFGAALAAGVGAVLLAVLRDPPAASRAGPSRSVMRVGASASGSSASLVVSAGF